MTATVQRSGTASTATKWQAVNWLVVEQQVLSLMREDRYGKVKSLPGC